MNIMQIKLAELIEDLDIYPRHRIDSSNVTTLINAIESGATLPPIVVDAKSKRIVDGFHRRRAYLRVHGPQVDVDVEMIDYPDEAEIVYDAVKRNAAHGRRLDKVDVKRSAIMLERCGIPLVRRAEALHMPVKKFRTILLGPIATSQHKTAHTVPKTNLIPLKRSMRHLDGQDLDEDAARAHDKMPGSSLVLTARQLIAAIQAGIVDTENRVLVQELGVLHDVLTTWWSTHGEAGQG